MQRLLCVDRLARDQPGDQPAHPQGAKEKRLALDLETRPEKPKQPFDLEQELQVAMHMHGTGRDPGMWPRRSFSVQAEQPDCGCRG